MTAAINEEGLLVLTPCGGEEKVIIYDIEYGNISYIIEYELTLIGEEKEMK